MNINPHRYLLATSLLVTALFCSFAHAEANQRYLEGDGFILFETEDADHPVDWQLSTQISGFRGTGYLEWNGPDYFSEDNAGNGAISYQFRIKTAGNYELRWRSRIAKGESNTESNDSWARLATGSNVVGEEALHGWTKVYMGESDTWSWSARTVDQVARPIRQHLTEGDHTIEISGRSYGHAIDQIALYRYLDVNFDSGLNGTLPLSLIMQEDGTITDPNPDVVPEAEIMLAERENVEPIATNSNETSAATCTENTLTLPALDAASFRVLNEAVDYNPKELSMAPGEQSVLLSYDLSQLPAFTTASLHYSTDLSASNGALDVYLGSHSDWPDRTNPDAPNAMVQLATAQGGWDADTRYASALVASRLPRELTTLLLSIQTGSDKLSLDTNSAALPMLVVTGDNNFCSNWAAISTNQAQYALAPEQPNATAKKSSGGSLDLWLGLALFAGFSNRTIRQYPQH